MLQLTAITFFNPNRPNLMHRNFVLYDIIINNFEYYLLKLFYIFIHRLQQQIYIYLLKRYLQMKYQSEYETNENLLKLMNSFKDLQELCELQKSNAKKSFEKYTKSALN